MNFQKTIIAGRLAHTPELKTLPSGTKVANFTLVTNRVWKDGSGEKKESVEYHNCIAFGRTAETLGQYAEGGQVLLVEGRNQTTSWEDKNGGPKRYKTEVVIDMFQFGQKSTSRAEKGMKYGMTPEEQEKALLGQNIELDDAIDYPDDVSVDEIPF